MKHTVRYALNWIGAILATIAVIFVARRLWNYNDQIDFSSLSPSTWSWIIVCTIVYGLANILLAQGWRSLLRQLDIDSSFKSTLYIYGVSQLGKYVPGNIFHIAGRQALGMAMAIPGWTLAKSALWELVLLSIAAITFSVLVIPLLIPSFPIYANSILFLILVFILYFILQKFISIDVSFAFINYWFFLLISGSIFVGLIELLATPTNVQWTYWPTLAGAFIIAWFIGLVTPGAPAGVGIRELVLIFLLSKQIHETDLLMSIIFGRMVTITGDILFFLIAITFKKVSSNVS